MDGPFDVALSHPASSARIYASNVGAAVEDKGESQKMGKRESEGKQR
jgi:hypothetical protein